MEVYTVGSIIQYQFNTRDGEGNPITFAGSPSLAVRKNVETSTNTDGITLVIDSGSVTGLHTLSIDTSQNGTFYTTSNNFFVIVATGTVDGNSVVGETVLEFKLGEVPVDVKKWNSSTLPDVATQTSVDTIDSNVDSILEDTNTTIPGLINTIDSNIDSILEDTNTTIPGLINTIDSNVDSILEDTNTTIPNLISGMFSGSGSISWNYTSTNSITGLPIIGVHVWVTTDITGLNIVGSGYTNSYGVVTFNLDPGTVYVWCEKVGYTFENPDMEVVE